MAIDSAGRQALIAVASPAGGVLAGSNPSAAGIMRRESAGGLPGEVWATDEDTGEDIAVLALSKH
jgi:hypothetical protein